MTCTKCPLCPIWRKARPYVLVALAAYILCVSIGAVSGFIWLFVTAAMSYELIEAIRVAYSPYVWVFVALLIGSIPAVIIVAYAGDPE